MKQKTMILMAVAISCGLAASYMTTRLLAERDSSAEDQKIEVLVAKKALSLGDFVKNPDDFFELKAFTKGTEPQQSLTTGSALKGKMLRRSLRPGDFVTLEDFGDKDGSVGYLLPDGYRAVGINVNKESGASGWATMPLSRVDIIGTFRGMTARTATARVVLENVLVLAADQSAQRDETGKPIQANVVTVALTPEEALKVRLAGELGSLSLMLRKMNDSTVAEGKTVTADEATGMKTEGTENPPQVAANPEVPATPAPEPKVEPKAVTPTPAPPVVAQAPKQDAPMAAPAPEPNPVRQHAMVIQDGERTRTVLYQIDRSGAAIGGGSQSEGSSGRGNPGVAPEI